MTDSFLFDEQTGCLAIRGELTIYQANAAVESLRSAVASGALARIDLAGVTELDTTGLQWLLLTRRLSGPESQRVALINPSPSVCEVLEIAGIGVPS